MLPTAWWCRNNYSRLWRWAYLIKSNFITCHKAKLLFRLWAQGLVKILKLVAEVWLRLQNQILVKVLKLCLANILSLCLANILMFGWDLEVNAQSKFRNCLIKICVITCDMNSTLGSVVPLGLWQCLVISEVGSPDYKTKSAILKIS